MEERRAEWRFQSRGSRHVQRSPQPVRIFVCLTCQRWFCDAAFGADYWKKRAGIALRVFHLIAEGQALRQAARVLGLSVNTVKRAERGLAKQALLLHQAQEQRLIGKVQEPLVLDGARSFTGSQYEPAEVNGIFGASTGFCFELRAFGLRRSGRMSEAQKQVRQERDQRFGRPDPQARVRLCREALLRLEPLLKGPIEVRTDEEPGYLPAIAALSNKRAVRHIRISSHKRRDSSNPLWVVNHKHRLLRHSLASWRRETIAHHKTLQGLQDRQMIHRTWLNNTKGISERSRQRAKITPAMLLGLQHEPCSAVQLFGRRLFPTHFALTRALKAIYFGLLTARPKQQARPHLHKFAF